MRAGDRKQGINKCWPKGTLIMSCHWHDFHTTQFVIFISYLYDVWTQAMNTINTTTCHHGYMNGKFNWTMRMANYSIFSAHT